MTLAVEIASGVGDDTHNAPLVPGGREPGMLTTFGALAAGMDTIIPDGPSTMDATTIAERQREGGGAPSQRRSAGERLRWKGLGQRLQQFAMATRALAVRQFRTNHV